MQRHELIAAMGELHRRGTVAAFDEAVVQGTRQRRTVAEILAERLRAEAAERQSRAIRSRLGTAGLPEVKDLDGCRFDPSPVNEALVRKPARGRVAGAAAQRRAGRGHGQDAPERRHRRPGDPRRRQGAVLQRRGLGQPPAGGEQERQGGRSGQPPAPPRPRVLDELGYLPVARSGGAVLFHLLARLHGQAPVIVTTNLGFADWPQVFGDARMPSALLDRLTHHCDIVETGTESYRLRTRS